MIGLKFSAMIAAVTMGLASPVDVANTLLRRVIQPGSVDEYEIRCTQVTSMSGDGSESRTLKVSWNAAYGFSEPEPGKPAPLEIKVTGLTYGGDIVWTMKPPSTMTVHATIDSRNRIASATNPSALVAAPTGWLLADTVELPATEVKVGDTWNVVLPKGMVLDDQVVTLPAKLTGEADYKGHAAWEITLERKKIPTQHKTRIRLSGDGGGTDASVTGTADITLVFLLEKGTCRPLSIKAKVHKEESLSFEGVQQPPSTTEYSATMNLKLSE